MRLLERAGARRIDERGVEGGEFVGSQRTAEEVARLGSDIVQAWRCRGGASQRSDGGVVCVGGEHLMATREPQRKSARATEQVGDPS